MRYGIPTPPESEDLRFEHRPFFWYFFSFLFPFFPFELKFSASSKLDSSVKTHI